MPPPAELNLDAPHQLFAEGCVPDYTLVLNDASGSCLARLQAVQSTLALWSPVLRGAMECTHCSWGQLPLQVEGCSEVEAWKVALCLMHPLNPQSGASPSALLTIARLKGLLMLADKYNIQGLLPFCKDVLLNPRYVCGVRGISGTDHTVQLDAFEWIQIAEGVPGFEAVVSRCIQQIVLSTTTSSGRVPRTTDKSRYTGHDRLMQAMSTLRPETSAHLAASMASCLATLSDAQGGGPHGYHMTPTADSEWGWTYSWSH